MGQPVAVVEKPTSERGIVRFEANRSLTGMGHERFTTSAEAVGPRPAAELARRLFATGRVEGVHVFSNIITVNLQRGCTSEGLQDVVRDLYQYWRPGMEPPAFAEPAPEEGAPAAAAPDAGGGGGGGSAYETRIPATLRERSAAALARWRSSHGG
jgi:hypothetical protein